MKLGLGLSLANRGGAGGLSSPIPSAGLSLWLKADAGVNIQGPYNYVSEIVISGTSNPDVNGTYTATTVPTFNSEGNRVNDYTLSSTNGYAINWDYGEELFFLYTFLDTSGFSSSDGEGWTIFGTHAAGYNISGFTGIYSGANGTYNYTSIDDYDIYVNGSYYILNNGLYYGSFSTAGEGEAPPLIATNNSPAYAGAWTPAEYLSSTTLLGAGATAVDGVYTRTDTQVDVQYVQLSASGGKTITYFSQYSLFLTTNSEYSSEDLSSWSVGGEDFPAPTSTFGYSNRNVGSPATSSVTFYPSGSISSSISTSSVQRYSVATWLDNSLFARDAYAGDYFVTKEIIGGKQYIRFPEQASGTGYSGNTIWYPEPPATVFFVARFPNSISSGSTLLSSDSFQFGRGFNGSNSKFFVTTDNTNYSESNSNLNDNTIYLLASTFDTSTVSLYINGTSAGSGITSESNNYGSYEIGGNQSQYSSLDGVDIAETIVYNRILTTPERQQVEAYLNAKYAIYVPFSETGAFWQSCPAGGCNNVTTPSGWNISADSIHTYTDNKMQYNSAGDGQTTFTHTYFFPYTADSTSPYNGNGWPGVQFQPRNSMPATPVFDGGSGSMCRITWNNMVIFEQIDGSITTNMGYYYNGNTTSMLQNLYNGFIPYSYAQTPPTIPDTYFMNFKIESVNSSLEFEIGFLWD